MMMQIADTTNSSQPTVIVIGGGIAGLTAARLLKQKGFHFCLLEAQEKLGGRLQTQLKHDKLVELGGEFIDSPSLHPHTHDLAQALGVPLTLSNMIRRNFLHAEKPQTLQQLECEAPYIANGYHDFWAKTSALAEKVNLEDPLKTPDAKRLDSLSAQEWLNNQALPAETQAILSREISLEYGHPREVSLLHLLLHTKVYENADYSEEEMYRFEGGSGDLIDALYNALAPFIRLNAPVHAIEQEGQYFNVYYKNQVVRADYVIIATPLPPLRDVQFSPCLPSAIQQAICKLNYSDHKKTIISFESEQPYAGPQYVQTTGELGGHWFAPPLPAVSPQQNLECEERHTAGTSKIFYTLASESAPSQAELLQQVKSLPNTLSTQNLATVQILEQSWQEAPFVGGSFSTYAPGEMHAYWHALRNPVGNLIFAGEHTATHFTGYIEGAIESAHRAVKQVQQLAFGQTNFTKQSVVQQSENCTG